MKFRQYANDLATLQEWSRQLHVLNNGIYRLYPTVDNTLNHWKHELNIKTNTNLFDTYNTPKQTIHNWENQLNRIYN